MNRFIKVLGIIAISTTICVGALHSQPLPLKYHLRAVYKLEYQKDSSDPKTRRTEYMQLYIGDTSSIFESVNYGMVDSAIASENKKGNKFGPPLGFAMELRTEFMYLIQKQQERIVTYDYIGTRNLYYYTEKRNISDWKIFQDTTSIGGFLCQKAETQFGGRTWTVWFTTEIPISDGPYKFCGLPGLILQVNDAKNYWNFSLVSITNIDTTIAPGLQNKKPEPIKNKATFIRELKYYKDNLVDIEVASGGVTFPSAAEKERNARLYRERRKHDNNWIELYDRSNKER